MSQGISIPVSSAPPAKDGSFSIRNPRHPDAAKVAALRQAMRTAMAQHEPFEGVPLRLTMHYRRGIGRGDALNLINGVADINQRRCSTGYECDVWVIDDDASIKEFHYTEATDAKDSYAITIEVVGR